MISKHLTTKSFGIARKFIFAIVLFSTLLTLLGTCLQLYIDYRKDLKAVRQQLTHIETSHRQSLINDIWLFNEPGLKAQMTGILALPMIEQVRVERKDAPELVVSEVKSRHLISHSIQLEQIHRGTTIQLGTLHLTAGTDGIVTRLKERSLVIFITQFVQVFVVSAFIFFLFYSLIGRHLAAMARHAASVDVSNLGSPLQLDRNNPSASRDDELDQVVTALNSMQSQIGSYIQERRQIEEQLRAEITERKRIEETLHEQAALLEDEIAQRQQAQEELNVINSSLEERISSAVTELRHRDELLLHQSRLTAMGELLNNIAHQWRQPLNNIAVYIQSMQYLNRTEELTPEEMDRDIRSVMEILQNLSHTIDNFRSFFIKDREKREFVVREMVDKTLSLLQTTLDSSGITVRLTAEENIRAVGFPTEYAQALLNILYNARDVLLERQVAEPLIRITIRKAEKGSLLSIRDNGGGIPGQILHRIFEPYVTTKGPSQGTGIGLYMAKTMIERNMGGRLTAHNVEHGAEFRIIL